MSQVSRKEMRKIVSQIRKTFNSKQIKIDHDTMFGTVEFTYVDKNPKIQKAYQGLKKLFRSMGLKVDYSGKSFTVHYRENGFEEATDSLHNEGQELLKTLL